MKKESINCITDISFANEEELLKYVKSIGEQVMNNSLVRLARNEIALYDLFNNKYLWYRSTQSKVLEPLYELGFTNERNPDFFFKYLTKDDARFLRDTIKQTVIYLQKKNDHERKDFVLLLDATMKHPNGTYYRFVHQSIVLISNAKEAEWLVLCILSLIDIGPNYAPPLRMLRHAESRKTCLFGHRNNQHTISFTDNQQELIRYIALGLTHDEIAQLTHRSKNTINHSKANIMRKINSNKVAQLVNYAKIIGLA